MISTKHVGLLSGAAVLAMTGICTADGTEASVDELRNRLNAAEAKIAELQTQNSDTWLTEQRAEEIRGLVHDVLADADTRASLLQSGMTAGYDDGAVIGSNEGNWLMRTNLLMQQRFIWNNQDTDDTGDDDRWGFENTRTKFIISGHVVNPDWFYRVDINVANPDDRSGTLNAYLGYDYGEGWKIMMGTFKAPLLREELVEAQYQLAVERSVANYAVTGGYVDGVALKYDADTWRGMFSLNDGLMSGQTSWSTADTEFAVTGRAEFLINGTWEQFDDFTSPIGAEEGLMVGVAGHWQQGEFGATGLGGLNGTGTTEFEVWVVTADVSIEMGGWNAFAALTYADISSQTGAAGDTNPFTFVVQGGYYLDEQWEIFGRYEWGDADTAGVEDLGLFTVGFNRYFAGHNAKWTTDVGFGFDEVDGAFTAAGVPSNLTGWRSDAAGEDGQLVVRTQWQIYF